MKKWKRLLLPLLAAMLLLLGGCEETSKYPYVKVIRDDLMENSVKICPPAGSRFVEYDVEDDGYTIILRFAKEEK